MLGLLAESITGLTIEQALREHVFQPLGMNNTSVPFGRAPQEGDDGLAVPHFIDASGRVTVMPQEVQVFPKARLASGGVVSCVDDVLRFGRAHLHGGGYLTSESQEQLWRDPVHAKPDGVAQGLVWRVESNRGMTLISHNGRLPGYRSTLAIAVEAGIVVTVLTNSDAGDRVHRAVTNELRRRVLGNRPSLDSTMRTRDGDAEIHARIYASTGGATVGVQAAGQSLRTMYSDSQGREVSGSEQFWHAVVPGWYGEDNGDGLLGFPKASDGVPWVLYSNRIGRIVSPILQ